MQRENEVQHVFLVGAKSLGAYGGYETFVYKLTEYHQNKKNIKYHALMLCRLYCRAEKLVVFQSNGYHYLERIDSASSKRSFSILKMWFWGVKEQSKIVEDNCPSCLVYMNYKKTIYLLYFISLSEMDFRHLGLFGLLVFPL